MAAPWQLLADWVVPSEPGNERLAMRQVAAVVGARQLPARRLERLKTAVAEATMNAMEHGNHYRPELPVQIAVLASPAELAVRITDQGGGALIGHPETPDLEAKLANQQTPRGWGLFLIKNMVDELRVSGDDAHHTIELVLRLDGADAADGAKGDGDGSQNA